MQAAAHNGKYDIVRQAGMDLVKIHHDLENEKQPQPMAQKSPSPLNYQQSPSTPRRSPFQLAQKCAPTSPQVQNPALKCARPFLSGFKMRAACAPRCANFPKNPIFRVKNRLLPFSAPCVGSGDSDLFLLKKMAFSLPPDTMAPVAAHF
jgi:hypothetical protein